MKKTSPNIPYTDRFRFWSRTHGGSSPHGGTGGTQPVDSHRLSDLHHHHPQSSDFQTIDLEAQSHASNNSHGPSGNGNDNKAATSASMSPSTIDGGQVNIPEAAPKGAVVNETQENESNNENSGSKRALMVRFGKTSKMILLHSKINLLLVFVPVGIIVAEIHAAPSIIFAMNAIAIIPLAGLLSHATESVARKFGDATGALLNVTFGNAVELIIL
jgi:Ca2+:H+ antiporter